MRVSPYQSGHYYGQKKEKQNLGFGTVFVPKSANLGLIADWIEVGAKDIRPGKIIEALVAPNDKARFMVEDGLRFGQEYKDHFALSSTSEEQERRIRDEHGLAGFISEVAEVILKPFRAMQQEVAPESVFPVPCQANTVRPEHLS